MACNVVAKVDKLLVDQLCTIASVSRVVAANLLEACDNNLEMALNMHMEGMVTDSGASHAYTCSPDEVRAPIPQRQEVLVEGPDELAYSFRGRRRIARSVFDKFRDFEAETKRQEELLGESSAAMPETSNAHRKSKKKTLEDLFRPPLDIMFRGSFQTAKESAVSAKKWLMINIQNSCEFPCQVLNRDVWSTNAVKSIINEYFIFWQIYHDSDEGRRYMNFYPVNDWPYVSIIDPRTGECLIFWHKINAATFCDVIMEFLSMHPSFDEVTSPVIQRKKVKKSSSILEDSEDAQLEAAIQASLQGAQSEEKPVNGKTMSPPDSETEKESDVLETFDSDSDVDYSESKSNAAAAAAAAADNDDDDDDDNWQSHLNPPKKPKNDVETQDWKSYLGPDADPESKLLLRLPDGGRDSIVMPCSSRLMALVKYIATKGFSNESYEMVTNFPKRQLSYLDFEATLKDIGLFPQETIFIQKR